jgi:hypothetical protein
MARFTRQPATTPSNHADTNTGNNSTNTISRRVDKQKKQYKGNNHKQSLGRTNGFSLVGGERDGQNSPAKPNSPQRYIPFGQTGNAPTTLSKRALPASPPPKTTFGKSNT